MRLAKLNHVLIPARKEDRDALRFSRRGRVLWWLFSFYFLLSDEGRGAFLCWLVVSALAINVPVNQYYVFWSLLTALLGVSISLRRTVSLHGVRICARAPRRVAVGDAVTFSVELHNDGEKTHHAIRIAGPFLPWDGRYEGAAPSIATLGPHEVARVAVSARFVARGEHHLDPFQASALAPLGLAVSKAVSSEGARFLVVPTIAAVKSVDASLSKRFQPGGIALASAIGESRELVGVRPYRPGDPVRDIHARTSARVGAPVVREYREEYFTRIAVVLDTQGGVADEPVLEAAVSLVAGIAALIS